MSEKEESPTDRYFKPTVPKEFKKNKLVDQSKFKSDRRNTGIKGGKVNKKSNH